jgi:hypothetical protein
MSWISMVIPRAYDPLHSPPTIGWPALFQKMYPKFGILPRAPVYNHRLYRYPMRRKKLRPRRVGMVFAQRFYREILMSSSVHARETCYSWICPPEN